MLEAKNFNYGMNIDHKRHWRKKCKIWPRKSEGVTWPTFWIFGPPPYFVNGWARNTIGTKEKCKIRSKEGLVGVSILGPLPYFRNGWS